MVWLGSRRLSLASAVTVIAWPVVGPTICASRR